MNSLTILMTAVIVFLLVPYVYHIFSEPKEKRRQVDHWFANQKIACAQARPLIPPGQYLVIYDDTDYGSIAGGRPDPEPKIFPRFSDAIREAFDEYDDEMRRFILDSNGELVCVILGKTVTSWPTRPA